MLKIKYNATPHLRITWPYQHNPTRQSGRPTGLRVKRERRRRVSTASAKRSPGAPGQGPGGARITGSLRRGPDAKTGIERALSTMRTSYIGPARSSCTSQRYATRGATAIIYALPLSFALLCSSNNVRISSYIRKLNYKAPMMSTI